MRKGLVLLIALGLAALVAPAAVIYDSITDPLPPSSSSLGYQATSTAEFGNLIGFSGSDRSLSTVEIVLTNWAYRSQYAAYGNETGFDHSFTLNLYEVGAGNSVGAAIASQTITVTVPWRPEPTPGSCSGSAYLADNGTCYNGANSIIQFTFSGVTLPDQIIFGLAYNTQSHGYAPIGAPAGPYNSLNLGLTALDPTVGNDPLPGSAYWNTSHGPFYADNGASGVGVFRQDTGWDGLRVQARFTTDSSEVPEPATWLLSGLGVVAITVVRRKRSVAE